MPNLGGPTRLVEISVLLSPAETPGVVAEVSVWAEVKGRRARVVAISGDLDTTEACMTALDFVGLALAEQGLFPVVIDWGMDR